MITKLENEKGMRSYYFKPKGEKGKRSWEKTRNTVNKNEQERGRMMICQLLFFSGLAFFTNKTKEMLFVGTFLVLCYNNVLIIPRA